MIHLRSELCPCYFPMKRYGKPLSEKCHVYLGIAQIAFDQVGVPLVNWSYFPFLDDSFKRLSRGRFKEAETGLLQQETHVFKRRWKFFS